MKGIYYKTLFKHKRSRIILLATIFTFLLLSTYFSFYSYNSLLKQHEQSSLMRLNGIVNSVSLLIDPEMHKMLMQSHDTLDGISALGQDMYYDQIQSLLEKNTEANMLKSPIYSLVWDSSKQLFVFGVSSSKVTNFRHEYKNYPSMLVTHQNTGGMIPPFKDEFGHWLTAFAPIKDSTGNTIALLLADEKYDVFLSQTKFILWKNLILSMIISLGLFFILFRILNNMLMRELQDKNDISSANERNKQMSTALQYSLDELQKTDDFRKEMIANFSHDLRTPLASIKGYLELLLASNSKKEQAPADQKKYTEIAYKESLRLERLINQLFELSKLESGHVKLKTEFLFLPELSQDVFSKYQEVLKEKNIRFITEFRDNLHTISADISWIDRLLQNLMDNAIKFTQENGFIKFTIFEKDNFQHLKVCNSGIPIPADELSHIFDRYFKSNQQTTHHGTGLGLAIVKKIVELHHGKVWAECADGITTFRFTLPLS